MNKAIFKENIRRFWPVSFAAFIAYFMCGPFYLLQGINDSSYGLLSSAVSTSNVGYCFVTCAMTVAIGAAVYAYLFKVNSAVFMHAAPVSRKDLFVSSSVSGLALSFAPVLMNALVLIALKLSGRFEGYFRSGSEFRVAEMWNVKSIIGWMIVVWVEIFFIFAICTLSAMISGNAVINVLTSCGLNLLTTLIYFSAISYESCFLFGYSGSMNEEVLVKLHPVLKYGTSRMIFGNGELIVSDLSLLCYILVAAAIFAVSYLIYTKRPNEKAGDSYVFDIVNVIICVLMVYMGASCIGLIFKDNMGLWGFVIGGAFSFLVGQLIIQKSFRIFNRRLLTALIASAAAMVLVIGGFAFDIFGMEKRVPGADSVESVRIWDTAAYGGYYSIKDPQNIEALTAFHSEIAANRRELTEAYEYTTHAVNSSDSWHFFEIDYTLKNGKILKRSYTLPDSFSDANGRLDEVYRSSEILSVFASLKNADPQKTQITLHLEDQGAAYAYDEPAEKKDHPIVLAYGDAYEHRYGDYYGMYDFTTEEKAALMQALAGDIERIGLRKIDPYSLSNFCNLEIEIVHSLDEKDIAEECASGEYYNNFRSLRYIYDENGKTSGISEEFRFEIQDEFTATAEVILGIFENRFN